MKKYFSVLIAFVILISLFYTVDISANSAMRLNKYSVTIGYNETYQLKITNIPSNYKVDSIKWLSDNNKVATVSKNGLITGKTRGTTKITATIGKNILKCNVVIKASLNNIEDALNNITYEYKDMGDEVIYVIKNNDKYDISAKFILSFYNGNNLVDEKTVETFIFSNNKRVIEFPCPYYKYDSCKLSYETSSMQIPMNYNSQVQITPIINTYNYRPNISSEIARINLVDLSIDNTTEKLVNLNAYVVFYKDNKLVATHFYSRGTIPVGQFMLYNPFVSREIKNGFDPLVTLNVPDYDNYEIVYSAYK